jgi:hypothetical protein
MNLNITIMKQVTNIIKKIGSIMAHPEITTGTAAAFGVLLYIILP